MRLQDRMVFRLYIGPVLLLILAIFAQFMTNHIVETGKTSAMTGIIANGIAPIFYWAFIGLIAWSSLWALFSTWCLWKWEQVDSNEPCCHVCGGLLDLKNGRYGYYYKCLACGKTRSL